MVALATQYKYYSLICQPPQGGSGKGGSMFSGLNCPRLMQVIDDVADLLVHVEATKSTLAVEGMAVLAEAWPGFLLRYSRALVVLVSQLIRHPEWAEEVEILLEHGGCSAITIPLVEEFLKNRGVWLEV